MGGSGTPEPYGRSCWEHSGTARASQEYEDRQGQELAWAGLGQTPILMNDPIALHGAADR